MFDVTAITLNKETFISVCDRVSQFLNLKIYSALDLEVRYWLFMTSTGSAIVLRVIWINASNDPVGGAMSKCSLRGSTSSINEIDFNRQNGDWHSFLVWSPPIHLLKCATSIANQTMIFGAGDIIELFRGYFPAMLSYNWYLFHYFCLSDSRSLEESS